MKFLLGLLAFLMTIIAFILYTPYVTDELKPYVEKEIEKQIGFDIILKSLNLHVNSFDLDIVVTPSNHITVDGSYSPFNKQLNAQYKATLNNLAELKEYINYDLLGNAIVTGSLTYKQNNIQFDAHSNMYDGIINATFNNSSNELRADYSQIQSLKLLKMLQYPKILHSDINGTLIYNKITKKGILTTQINNASIAENPTMNLLREVSAFNIYDAKFNGSFHSKINKNLSISHLKLVSSNASITSNEIHIDTKENTIKTDLHVIANQYPFDIKVSGDIKRPHVSLDTKEVLKNELGRYLNRLIKELF